MRPLSSIPKGRSRPNHAAAASHRLRRLRVGVLPGETSRGRLQAGTSVMPCVLGPGGVVRRKREGDGATPAGHHALLQVLFRADHGPRPPCGLPARALRPGDGWCDDPGRADYNRAVRLPARGSHEGLWRADRLYDVLVVLDYNVGTVRKGRGSAIFLHVWAGPAGPTAGCVALDPVALRRLLTRVGPRTRLAIG